MSLRRARKSWRIRCPGLLAGVAVLLAGLTGTVLGLPAPAAARSGVTCRAIKAPVRIGGATGNIAGTLCVPAGAKTVELLAHGFSSAQYYWDLPYQPERYSFARAANRSGKATLSVDRLGSGASYHPNSARVTLDNNASVLHQLVQGLRAGRFGTAFRRVVLVGHSYGSLSSYLEAGRYRDVDALVSTGATHRMNLLGVTREITLQSHPAASDPKFAGSGLDAGYLTTRPGQRTLLYNVPDADPAVIALDDRLKQTYTLAEAVSYLPDYLLNSSRAINIPVYLVVGAADPYVCGNLMTEDCSSAAALARQERAFYGPRAKVEAIIVPGAGHNVTLQKSAPGVNASIQSWISRH